jgi:two-component system phosphate regulon sensor histidine kinase PhoR
LKPFEGSDIGSKKIMDRKKRLIWQLFPSYLLITVLSVLAVSWYASSSLRHFFIDQTAADLRIRAVLVEKQITAYLTPLDAAAVDAVCKEIGKNSATRMTVILPDGQVVGDSRETPRKMDNHAERPEIATALKGRTGMSRRYSKTLKQKMMYVAIPLQQGNTTYGVIRASLPTTSIDRELRLIQIKIALGGLLIALIAAGISLLISRRISRPIEEMKKGADHFADGDLTHRLAAPDSEELASLAEALNQMAAQLDRRIKTIVSQHNELETVLASMLEGVIAVDNEERIINMNAAAVEFFDCDPEKYQGRDLQEVIRNSALQQFVRRAISSKVPKEDDIGLYHNGEKTLHLQSSPLLDANKDPIGTLVVFNDVTQLRRLENMRRDFVANVSHEIKTPLTAIKGFVETLHQGSVDNPEEARRFLGIIQKHVDRLSSIVEDLLDLSRIEQEDEGKTVNLEEGNIGQVFRSVLQLCRPKAEEKNITVTIVGDDRISARFDSSLLEQAMVNLLDNAIKYSEPESVIRLKAQRNGSEIKISVEDQGIGIAKKHLPRLFERFYRVDKARSRKMGGTGLGLAIVKHIAQAHGGNVTVDSTLGKGSTFTIHLPVG